VATYASSDDLNAYLAGDRGALRALRGADVEALLERGERAVDLALGPSHYTRDATTGLLLDPGTLTDAQRGALSRATCAYVEWLLLVGSEWAAGDSLETAGGVVLAAPPQRTPPKMLSELQGFGLLKRSATVLPPPPPVVDEFAPCDPWEW
jgi:hypothetical protein